MPLNYPSTFTGCAPKTAFLADYFGKNVPTGRDNGSLAFLQFLLSAQNTSGVRKLSDDILAVPGKKRGVKMLFESPLCVKVCSTEWNCADPKAPISPAVQYAEFDIETEYHACTDAGAPAALTFTDSEWAGFCDLDDEAFLQNQFAQFDMSMFKAVDKQLVQLFRTLIDISREVSLPFLRVNSTTGYTVLADDWLLWVSEKLSDEGIDIADVVIFGGRMIKTISHKYKVATASTEGFDLSATAGDVPELFYDKNFDSVFGTNAFVVVPKKSLQLVAFNKYVGQKSFRGEKEINFTKVMPLGNGTSLTFDYQWRRDVDCPGYTYFPSLMAELVKTVSGACANPDADGLLVFRDCGTNALPVCV